MKTSRRRFPLSTTAAAVTRAGHSARLTTPPNVPVMHIDVHRIGCPGAYGNSAIRTPAIDAPAAGGVFK